MRVGGVEAAESLPRVNHLVHARDKVHPLYSTESRSTSWSGKHYILQRVVARQLLHCPDLTMQSSIARIEFEGLSSQIDLD